VRGRTPSERLSKALLVTGNPGKAREVVRILGIEIAHAPLDLPEIQELDVGAILHDKAERALLHFHRPIIVDETSLELAALGGFPGPLVKWLLRAVGADGIARLTEQLGVTRAVARCAVLYRDDQSTFLGEGATEGRIVRPRGGAGFGWDPVFLPDGETQTYAELDDRRKDEIGHRGKALQALLERMDRRRDPET
jgi:non-canonical purine NTP pyrophosphatase (RdgB/HAM1 family)